MRKNALIVPVLAGATFCGACTSQPRHAPPSAASALVDRSTVGTVTGRIGSPVPGAIVTLATQSPAADTPPATMSVLDQVQMTFVPDTLIASAGAPVTFHSSDTELHNINVRNADTRTQEFNRSIFPGGSFEHTFAQAGFYDVRCDIHPAMAATIFVSSTPYATLAGPDGTFSITDVPPGRFTLTVYNGSRTTTQVLDVSAGLNQVAPTAE